jgi:AcrR family transcriptional regulator
MNTVPSARQVELLERAYAYAIMQGSSELSLRPLATSIGSSPRVLLYLFGSKDGLIRALLARARTDELALLSRLRRTAGTAGLAEIAAATWSWLAAPEHRQLLTLWLDGYARSLTEPTGPWANFANATVSDWLTLLADAQPPAFRHTEAGLTERTLVLAVLRGALLDLLATGEVNRISRAVHQQLSALQASGD